MDKIGQQGEAGEDDDDAQAEGRKKCKGLVEGDRALIELHGEKTNWEAFKDNAIDLDIVKDNELRHPTMLDADGEKHGIHETSMELAIYSYGPGFIMADGKGRIVGLLTGGAGQPDPLFD
ncbi:uncharacterized protein EI90DRAFT_3025755 [Cantharellus anzutake]|uniref:uncharacterized protein n=1 Tax=Cantharellus anzutake TaxID=1750568 RepID=UPI001905D9EC|nr:uncharacterized protein EI90DRAFT_3025755 [Cantharellus anzutake]KAF8308716.1 hypothetical protein EI90DRAFT_3025755 [Cantharellus anzutake]